MTVPTNRLHLGAAYYPEHWPEERWSEDMRLMREAGFTVVRMAEFAWSTLEPSEGEFRFGWLDRAIEMLAEHEIVSVLGTPTAAPPAWLVQQQPDLLAVDQDGRQVSFGNRCHYCVNALSMHQATDRIVEAMAKHFGPNPHVIGWQLDNEYNRVCHCDHCRSLFQQCLAARFGSLDELNARWHTAYWSQTYSSWQQIPIPVGRHNPGLILEWKRFVTQSYRQFQALQLDRLRPHLKPDDWVTHNFMGWFDAFDHYKMAEDLDLASWDCYVPTGHHDYARTGAQHDLTRGLKQRNFWLMETQPGNVNWGEVNTTLNKGEVRAMAWHAVGHGADAVLYWQWRSALGGQEQYHGTLVDQSGQPRLIYDEIAHLGQDFARVSELLAGSKPDNRVAIINDYDSRWSIQAQPHHRDFDYVRHLENYYRPLAEANIGVDIVPSGAPLDRYLLVIVPALQIASDEQIELLRKVIARHGHVVLTLRTGLKDEYSALLPERPPGPFTEMAGVEVEEYYAPDEPIAVKGNWFSGVSQYWAERVRILEEDSVTQPIARYGPSNGWLDDQLAITVHSGGRGLVYYVGTYLDAEAQKKMLLRFARSARIRPVMETPEGVETLVRVRPDKQKVYILINHTSEAKTVTLPWEVHEHLSDQTGCGDIDMAPYAVAVFTRDG